MIIQMNTLLSPYGRINRAMYWKTIIVLYVGYLLAVFLAAMVLESNVNDAAVFMAVIGLIFLAFAYFYVSLVLFLKRGRDAGNAVLWAAIGLIVPFGFIIVGILPSKKTS